MRKLLFTLGQISWLALVALLALASSVAFAVLGLNTQAELAALWAVTVTLFRISEQR